jgi:uncharacterized membrane protein YGL010W
MRLGISAPMQARFDEYGSHHRTSGNEVCHFVGIPCIVAGAAGLLGAVPLVTVADFAITLAEVVTLPIIVFYVVSARLLGLVIGTLMALLVAGGRALPLGVGLALFLGGWAVQFLGHAVYEKRSPAFLRNLVHLLIGPAWLVYRASSRLHVPLRG